MLCGECTAREQLTEIITSRLARTLSQVEWVRNRYTRAEIIHRRFVIIGILPGVRSILEGNHNLFTSPTWAFKVPSRCFGSIMIHHTQDYTLDDTMHKKHFTNMVLHRFRFRFKVVSWRVLDTILQRIYFLHRISYIASIFFFYILSERHMLSRIQILTHHITTATPDTNFDSSYFF